MQPLMNASGKTSPRCPSRNVLSPSVLIFPDNSIRYRTIRTNLSRRRRRTRTDDIHVSRGLASLPSSSDPVTAVRKMTHPLLTLRFKPGSKAQHAVTSHMLAMPSFLSLGLSFLPGVVATLRTGPPNDALVVRAGRRTSESTKMFRLWWQRYPMTPLRDPSLFNPGTYNEQVYITRPGPLEVRTNHAPLTRVL